MRNWLALAIVASLTVLIIGCGGTSVQPTPESAPDGDAKEKLTELGRDTISGFKDRLISSKSKSPAFPDGGEAAASPTSAAPNTSADAASTTPTSLPSAPSLSSEASTLTTGTATPESKLGITLPGSSITGGLPSQPSITTPTATSRARSGSEKKSAGAETLGSTLTSGKTSKSTMVETAVSLQ